MAYEDIDLLNFDVNISRREKYESELVREFQLYLDNSSQIDNELSLMMIKELNDNCNYIGRLVPIHGVVDIAYADADPGKIAIVRRDMQGGALVARGFGVSSRLQPDGTSRPIVGYFFDSPQPKMPLGFSSFNYDMRTFLAFAPYGSIDIEYQRSGVELAEHLDVIVPDLIAEIDDRVYSGGPPLEVLQSFGSLEYACDNLPTETLCELVAYANEVLDTESLGLLKFSLRGVYSETNDPAGATTYRVYDHHAQDGGRIEAIGRVESVFLAPHLNYVSGEYFASKKYYWKVTLAIEASTAKNNRLDDRSIDLTLTDITDVHKIDLRSEKL